MRIGISLPVRELGDDFDAIKSFAQLAEELGFTHLRVPEQIIRRDSGPLDEPITLMALISGLTRKIELVPFVMLPARQTVLVAKQVATLDRISGGRVRLGVGIGNSKDEYKSLGSNFHQRGARCEEQISLLRKLWTEKEIEFEGQWDHVSGVGINPLPSQQPIPIWIAASSNPVSRIRKRIGQQSDGWFVLCTPEEFPDLRDGIYREADASDRDPSNIGTEAGVAVVGPRASEWKSRVAGWRSSGLTHLCLRTLGGGLTADQHMKTMLKVSQELPTI